MVKPFFKWAGGKAGLLSEINQYVPEFKTYYEPFVGGGALFFSLKPQNAIISDSNGELIVAYQVVRDDVEGLISKLSQFANCESLFYDVRALNPLQLTSVERAARFVFLNKTCFNGLYRVNSKNQFNVPFGHYKNPNFCDKKTLRSCSRVLSSSGVEILPTYFDKVLSKPEEGDFVYLDPPYFPVDTKSFVGYSKKGFGQEDQELLAKTVEDMTDRGVKVLLSNSAAEWVYDRYSNFNIEEIMGSRSISAKGDTRGKVKELLIRNYL
ncbi:DNA adenine methylase [bacterium]|nr:DNA adenine methylase [bacterium]